MNLQLKLYIFVLLKIITWSSSKCRSHEMSKNIPILLSWFVSDLHILDMRTDIWQSPRTSGLYAWRISLIPSKLCTKLCKKVFIWILLNLKLSSKCRFFNLIFTYKIPWLNRTFRAAHECINMMNPFRFEKCCNHVRRPLSLCNISKSTTSKHYHHGKKIHRISVSECPPQIDFTD